MQKQTALAALLWQVEMGADEAVGEQPCMTLPEEPTAPVLPPAPLPPPPRQASRPSPPRKTAPPAPVKAGTLAELEKEVAAFEGCDLKSMAINLVFGEGDPQARIMILGEMPHEDDDRQGRPFCGEHGALLERMLAAIELKRSDVYLGNLVYWRPPGGRSPSQEEIEACLPFVERQIALVRPDLLLCLGAGVTRALLRRTESFSKLRGRWIEYRPPLAKDGDRSVLCLPTHPPSFLLRQPAAKRQSWQDLCLVNAKKNELSR